MSINRGEILQEIEEICPGVDCGRKTYNAKTGQLVARTCPLFTQVTGKKREDRPAELGRIRGLPEEVNIRACRRAKGGY